MRRVSPRIENSYSKFWYNKGVEFSESNEYDKALIAYNQALDIDDKDPDIWNNKCYVLIKLGRYEEAITAGKTGVNLNPNDPMIWDILRNAYLANKNPEKAAECRYKKSSSNNYGKAIGITCGLFILLLVVIAAVNNGETIEKSTSGPLYGIIFLILLIGILYEGWKAVTS